MKPLILFISFAFTLIATVTLSVVTPLFILANGNLNHPFANENERLLTKTIAIGGIIFGVCFGTFLWGLISRKKYTDVEIQQFSKRWIALVPLCWIVSLALKTSRRNG